MSHLDRLTYGVLLFLALAALAMWKRRRETAEARMKRGLTGFVSSQVLDTHAMAEPVAEVEAEMQA